MPYAFLDISAWYTKSTQKKKNKKFAKLVILNLKKLSPMEKRSTDSRLIFFFNKKLPSHVFKKDC